MSNDTKQIQITIDAAKEVVKDYDSLERLYKNKDFQRLIEKRYMQDEPIRITHLFADPACSTPEIRQSLQEKMIGVANFLAFLREINRKGESMKDQVTVYEQELELANQEMGA